MRTLHAWFLAALTALATPTLAGAQEGAESISAVAHEGVINIQTASVEELQRLPGIGPSKAEAIIAQRTRTPFRRIEDILRVRGIGRATFRRLRPYLTVTGPTTLTRDLPMRRAEPEA
jgi:competence protein ComEA